MRPQAQGQAPRNLPPSIPGRSRNIAGGILNTPDPQLDTLMTSLASPYPPETIANQLLRRWIEVLTDRTKYQSFLARRGEEAKKYLDELQTLIDSIGEKHHFRLMLVVGLFRLTRTSEICPESLLIKDVKYDMNGHVGDGSFGTVFRGTCRGYDICVKILKVKDSDRRTLGARRKAFLREGVLAVQQMHENVLPHYGIYELKDQNDRIALITPYMPKGNLSKYLESCPPNGNRLYLMYGIASGLDYLHRCGIVHGDIKPTNILITNWGQPCIADLGLSYVRDDGGLQGPDLSSDHTRGGTYGYQAPELIYQEKAERTCASDVYALSMTSYQIFTGCPPFDGKNYPQIIRLLDKRERPSLPSEPIYEQRGFTEYVRTIVEQCWNHEPQSRLLSGNIVIALNKIIQPQSISRQDWGTLSSRHFRAA